MSDVEVPALPSAAVADACIRAGVPLRVPLAGLTPYVGSVVAGRVRAVRHEGSVDVFLETIDRAEPRDVLVVDNDGRRDEGCIGDLTVLEAKAAGIAGVIVYGCHRDTAALRAIGMPVFSYGAVPSGPQRPRAYVSAQPRFGHFPISEDDVVFADEDGAVFVRRDEASAVIGVARSIVQRERMQAARVEEGTSLRTQFRFSEFLQARARDPALSFRQHLRTIGAAIEE